MVFDFLALEPNSASQRLRVYIEGQTTSPDAVADQGIDALDTGLSAFTHSDGSRKADRLPPPGSHAVRAGGFPLDRAKREIEP